MCSLSEGATAKRKKKKKKHTVNFFFFLCFLSLALTHSIKQWKSGRKLAIHHNTNLTSFIVNNTKKKNCNRFIKPPKFLKFAEEKMKQVASHDVFVWITYSFIPLNSCHPKVISIIMVSILPNGILAVIMYASALCRHYQSCHPESHKCNYTKPLITKQCNLLLE